MNRGTGGDHTWIYIRSRRKRISFLELNQLYFLIKKNWRLWDSLKIWQWYSPAFHRKGEPCNASQENCANRHTVRDAAFRHVLCIVACADVMCSAPPHPELRMKPCELGSSVRKRTIPWLEVGGEIRGRILRTALPCRTAPQRRSMRSKVTSPHASSTRTNFAN